MRYQHEADVQLCVELPDQLMNGMRGGAVEVAGGLVHQHASWIVDQRTCNRNTLPFTARQLRRAMCQAFCQTYAPEQCSRTLQAIGIGQTGNDQRHWRRDVRAAGQAATSGCPVLPAG